LVIGWMAVIFVGSSIPGTDMPSELPPDYMMHFLEYLILGLFTAYWANMDIFRKSSKASVLYASVIASGYAIVDELHQYFVPGRCTDPRDWLADTIGGLTGAIFLVVVMRVIKEKSWSRK